MTVEHRPPRSLQLVLQRILPRYAGETAVGDFEEEYNCRASERGKRRADIWYSQMILKSLPFFVGDSIRWGVTMLKNYLTITWRDIKANPVFSLINIFGLAVGMACCIIILLFVHQELSFDKFHVNAPRVYRLIDTWTRGGRQTSLPMVWGRMGPAIKDEFPEVDDFARLNIYRHFVVEHAGKRLATDPAFADPHFFSVFSYQLIRGDKKTVLSNPDSVVLSETLAKKFFDKENPLGKVMSMYSLNNKYDLQVTGIMKDMPTNSHVRLDFLMPFLQFEKQFQAEKRDPSDLRCVTYLLLAANADPQALEKKLPGFLRKQFGDQFVATDVYSLQPLTAIHLGSKLAVDYAANSKISVSYLLSAVALIILFIACINYINLSTARAGRRSREVGLRKVVGANRFHIFTQFLGESLFLSFLALLVAIVLAALLIPFFNSLMNQNLHLDFKGNVDIYGLIVLLTVCVGLLSGSYPALFLSSYKPVDTLKGEIKRGSRVGSFVRSGLVIFQFAISLVFIIGTFIMLRQMNYLQSKDLGFKKDNVIQIPIFKDRNLTRKAELIKRELGQHPDVLQVIVTEGYPGDYSGYPLKCVPEGFPGDKPMDLNLIEVGNEYFNFFGIKIIQGRDFSADIKTDGESAIILNEKAARALGWQDPIGRQITGPGFESHFGRKDPLTVIGVVKDFHNGSLHEEIKPTIYKFEPNTNSEIYVRIRSDRSREAIAFLENKWKELPTNLLFEWFFLDPMKLGSYQADRNIMRVFSFSAVLAITLACLGLFGLTLYAAERRKKEIGIRKAIGATESQIVLLLSKDFARLFLLANVIAWPIAYYIGHRWLNNFAYRIGIGPWIFILASMLTFLIAFLTIGYQSIKAASSNPAVILRHE